MLLHGPGHQHQVREDPRVIESQMDEIERLLQKEARHNVKVKYPIGVTPMPDSIMFVKREKPNKLYIEFGGLDSIVLTAKTPTEDADG